MDSASCAKCWKPMEVSRRKAGLVSTMLSAVRETLCNTCADELEREEKERALEERKARRELEFLSLCPPIYRESDPGRLLPIFREAVEGWRHGWRGLGLIGAAGSGKTRCAWLLLRRLYISGRSVFGVTATAFARAAADQWHDEREARAEAKGVLERCRNVSVLLLDDLGKQKMTERAELELFDVLEHRTSHARPTIWTANASPAQLKAMMSADRGEPIMRRLMEFSEVVTKKTK